MIQKSGDHQLRLVVYPMIYRVLYIAGFFFHQQYVLFFETTICKANGVFNAHFLMMLDVHLHSWRDDPSRRAHFASGRRLNKSWSYYKILGWLMEQKKCNLHCTWPSHVFCFLLIFINFMNHLQGSFVLHHSHAISGNKFLPRPWFPFTVDVFSWKPRNNMGERDITIPWFYKRCGNSTLMIVIPCCLVMILVENDS